MKNSLQLRQDQSAELAGTTVTGAAHAAAGTEYLKKIDTSKQRTIDFLVGINQLVQKTMGYTIRMEPGVQTPEETLTKGHRLLPRFRLAAGATAAPPGPGRTLCVGLPHPADCRCQVRSTAPSGPEKTSPTCTPGAKSSCPARAGSAWTPPPGLMAGEGHIAAGLHAAALQRSPRVGRGQAEVEFKHHMQVTRIYESPRVTPALHRRAVGQVLQALGAEVDRKLEAAMRLTMGGEPTFVATADRDAAEWNTDALGPHQARLRHRAGAPPAPNTATAAFCTWAGASGTRRAAAALGAVHLLACQGWQAHLEQPGRCLPTSAPASYTADDARRFTQALAASWA